MYRTPLLAAALALSACGGGLQTANELGQLPYGSTASCTGNSRPTVQLSLADGAVHDHTSPVTVTASDPDHLSEQLVLTWSSDVDGAQGELPVGADGTATLPVDALTLGDQAITVQVADPCGNTATTAVGACLQGEVTVPSVDFSSWRLSGDAVVEPEGWLTITPPAAAQVGSAFDDRRAVPANDLAIALRFTTGGQVGGDGFSITAADADQILSWHGGGGCGLGYGTADDCSNGIPIPGWSVELDFFGNDHDPVDGPHMAFTLDGQMGTPVAWAPIRDVRGLGWHQLDLVLTNGRLTVDLDGDPILDTPVDPADVAFPAYLGFTAGTGNSFQLHRIAEAETRTLACLPAD